MVWENGILVLVFRRCPVPKGLAAPDRRLRELRRELAGLGLHLVPHRGVRVHLHLPL